MTTPTGELLGAWRDEAGLTLDRAGVYASDITTINISRETVRRYESGLSEDDIRPLVLAGLMTAYGKASLTYLLELPPHVRAKVERAHDMFHSLCPTCREAA